MKRSSLLLSLTLAAVILPFSGSATVTPINSSLYLYVDVNAGVGPASDSDGMSQGATLNPLSGSASISATNPVGGTASSFMEGTASWTSAAAGHVTFHSRFISAQLSAYPDSRVAAGYNPDFVYTFRSDVAATFSVSYSVVHAGLYSYTTLFDGSGKIGDTYLTSFTGNGPINGVMSFAVQPGIDYTLWLAEGSNFNGDLPGFITDSRGTFDFQIVPVPETSVPALAGSALVWSAATRRRFFRRDPVRAGGHSGMQTGLRNSS